MFDRPPENINNKKEVEPEIQSSKREFIFGDETILVLEIQDGIYVVKSSEYSEFTFQSAPFGLDEEDTASPENITKALERQASDVLIGENELRMRNNKTNPSSSY